MQVLLEALPKPDRAPRRKQSKTAFLLVLLILALMPTDMAYGSDSLPQAQASQPQPTPATQPASQSVFESSGSVTEETLRQQLVGKPLFLRGGYLGDSLSFTEHGDPTGHPAAGSYTLSAIQIDKVRLTKHRVELEGSRYALHFLGALPYEDSSKAIDRIRITPKKKILKITIDREQVVKPKKVRGNRKAEKPPASGIPAAGQSVASSETDVPAAAAQPANEPQPAEQAAAEPASVTTTISPAHATRVLHDALDKIFAAGLDEKLRAQMPEFWQLYYQAQAAGVDYHPRDPKVLRSSAVDQQAKLLSSIAPDSNAFAQASGIAGRALYRAVIDVDGKPSNIAVVRPIGFGLDENAVEAIRKASFQPAVKDGHPVAETLDLAVLFRIYSNRTSIAAGDTPAAEPIKPGPYSVQQNQP